MSKLRLFDLIFASLCVAVLAVMVAPGWLSRLDPTKKPQLEGLNPDSIDLIVRLQAVARLTNTEPLMSLLCTGHPVHAHRCSYPGQLILHFTNGTSARVLLRPGHTNANYEFTWTNGLFAVSRPAFMSVLASAGVNTNEIPK